MDYSELPIINDDQFENVSFTSQKQIPLPTDDGQVRALLRHLGHPITLFGEGPFERRNRLKSLLISMKEYKVKKCLKFLQSLSGNDYSTVPIKGIDNVHTDLDQSQMEIDQDLEEDESQEFFTQGSSNLIDIRTDILKLSLQRARNRLKAQKIEFEQLSSDKVRQQKLQMLRKISGSKQKDSIIQFYGNQVAADRPLSSCSFSFDSKYLAVGCFGGSLRVWSLPQNKNNILTGDSQILHDFNIHESRVCGISWNPVLESQVNLASGSFDGLVHLWSTNQNSINEPVLTLDSHQQRVSSTLFHPCGKYLFTASYDASWRLWDLNAGLMSEENVVEDEELLQEGHRNGIHSIAINSDGSLLASGGVQDGCVRIWDLRSGRNVMMVPPSPTWNQLDNPDKDVRNLPYNYNGHFNQSTITSLSFSSNGIDVASASTDGTVKIHDVRMLNQAKHTILAGGCGTISKVCFRKKYQLDFESNSLDRITSQKQQQDFKGSYSEMAQYHSDYMITASFDGLIRIWNCYDYKLIKVLPCGAGPNGSVGYHGRTKIMDADLSNDGNWICSASFDNCFRLFNLDEN